MRHDIEDVTNLVDRLAVGFAHRFTGNDRAQAIAVWQDVLTGTPWPEVEQAADGFLKEPGRYMPKPGEIRSRALELAKRRFQPASRDSVVWHSERWSEGADVDGRPGLCQKCGNLEWFTRTPEGIWHGHVTHRESCGTARRKEAA
jgi:hypothetical protein